MKRSFLIFENDRYFVKTCTGYAPDSYFAVVPSNFGKLDFPYLKGRVGTDPDTGDSFPEVYLDEVAKGDALIAAESHSQKSELRKQYIADINAEMINIFGSTDRDKANAMYNTWQEWQKDPSFFSDKELVDEYGDPLDTASKIMLYAEQKLNQSKDYSVFLMKREQQYIEAKNAI